ncbi:hypothetical protein SODALDRAFT_320150 [Sodiomyces alkalinus F11]|uniref:Uncharacterized protein n=1 Tax=Sodiomyces alkalinus (strain CBS 110278 / VKM F-3762 / F11) TaxID=1314773 RepID=A0A3N2QAU1_SODAK|nr:hypothetical protein SODALDRAFT_320150 [Sodiomyces alkalinus F11]ROT43765.1 hypothetical protein SODALDRAFT_320150 [Sodiomyces alkalinus F11]
MLKEGGAGASSKQARNGPHKHRRDLSVNLAARTSKRPSGVKHNPEEPRQQSQIPPADNVREPRAARRDEGFSDEVWEQLQQDAAAETQRELERGAEGEAGQGPPGGGRQAQEEAEAKEKLKMRGKCPVGYHWVRQQGDIVKRWGPPSMISYLSTNLFFSLFTFE